MNATDPIAIARDFLLGDVMTAALECWRAQSKPWGKLSEAQQRVLLEEMTNKVRLACNHAVHIIASDARTCFVTHVKDVQFKEGRVVEAKLVMGNTQASHELADFAGQSVLVVLEDAARYTNGTANVEAEPDQPGLFSRSTEHSL